jgi:hypothetical protein
MRRAANVDKNQQAIVNGLRNMGVSVECIKKPVDLLVCFRGETSLMEVKNRDGFNRITKDQAEFFARWPGKVHIVRSLQEAIAAVIGKEVLR